MKSIFFSLKASTYLASREHDLALFYSFGHHIYVKSPLIDQNFEDLSHHLIEGKSLHQLQNLLPNISITQMESYFNLLKQHGLLLTIEEPHSATDLLAYQNSFLSNFYTSPQLVHKLTNKLKETTVYVIDLASLEEQLKPALTLAGVEKVTFLKSDNWRSISPTPPEESLTLVTGTWKSAPLLEQINSLFFSQKRAWLLVLKDLFGGQIGPYFSGQDSPCFDCLKKRKASFLEGLSGYHLIENSFFSPSSMPSSKMDFPLLNQMLSSWAALEVYKLIHELPSPQVQRGGVLFDILNLKTRFCELFPVPFCPTCSDATRHPFGSVNTPI